jgi:carbamoyltransferase
MRIQAGWNFRKGQVPVILNTSFNRQEPIVQRPEEAISCYLRTGMDVLVLGDFYTTDRKRNHLH